MQYDSNALLLDTDDVAVPGFGLDMSPVEAPDLETALTSPDGYDELMEEVARYAGDPCLIDPALQVIAMVPDPVTDLSALLGFVSAVEDALEGGAAECSATIDGHHVEFAETSDDVFALTIDRRQVATWHWDGDGLDRLD